MQDIKSINLGTVYESVVAQELAAHGFKLHYYDNKKKGEVDFLVDDYEGLTVLPLEVKSGKDYTEHSALTKFLQVPDYGINRAIVFSNEREVLNPKWCNLSACVLLYVSSKRTSPGIRNIAGIGSHLNLPFAFSAINNLPK